MYDVIIKLPNRQLCGERSWIVADAFATSELTNMPIFSRACVSNAAIYIICRLCRRRGGVGTGSTSCSRWNNGTSQARGGRGDRPAGCVPG